jgi:hypothetical protein
MSFRIKLSVHINWRELENFNTLALGMKLPNADRKGTVPPQSTYFHRDETGLVCLPHRVHRVATAAFWRTFSHEGKISPGW